MPKYEIMTILDPKAEMSTLDNLLSTVFGQNSTQKLRKLETTNLAYPIRKTKTAQYFLISLVAEPNLIEEFVRRANITKTIWRYLVVNLDSEKGLNQKPKTKDRSKRFAPKRERLEKPVFKINVKPRSEQTNQNQSYTQDQNQSQNQVQSQSLTPTQTQADQYQRSQDQSYRNQQVQSQRNEKNFEKRPFRQNNQGFLRQSQNQQAQQKPQSDKPRNTKFVNQKDKEQNSYKKLAGSN